MAEILFRAFGVLLLICWFLLIYHFIFSNPATPPSKKEKEKFLAILEDYQSK